MNSIDQKSNEENIDEILSQSKKILLKHNALISISGTLSETQYKAYNILLFTAKKVMSCIDKQQKIFRLKVSTLGEFAGIDFGKNYEYVKSLLEGIRDIRLETDVLNRTRNDEIEWGFMYLLASASIKKGNITFSFPGEIMEALLSPAFYTPIDLNTIKVLEGKYSIILYENLMSYKNMHGMVLSIQDFRKLTGLENKYKVFSDLKKRAIEPAINEIMEKTNMKIDVDYIRIKKRIGAIKFTIVNADSIVSNKLKKEKLFSIRALFDHFRLKYDEADPGQFIEYDLDIIRKSITQVIKAKPRNQMAYLHKALQQYSKYGFFSIEELEELKEAEKVETAEMQKKVIEMAGIDIKEIARKMKENKD